MDTEDKANNPSVAGEFALIREVFAPLADSDAARGLGDDAAVFTPPPGTEIVVTTDMMTAGVHFRMEDGPSSAAARILASNVSDLAAMAADPLGYTLALAVPADVPLEWLRAFAAQLGTDQARLGIPLVGGDTTRSEGPLCLSITAFGTVPTGRAVSRGGARPGDDLWVSGTIGDAHLGLRSLSGGQPDMSEEQRTFLRGRLLYPQPRLDLGELLRAHASAAIDISDGLLADAGHIAEMSGVTLTLHANDIPISEPARSLADVGDRLWLDMVSGGDDYEIAFTALSAARPDIEQWSRDRGLRLTRAGTASEAAAGAALRVIGRDGRAMAIAGTGGYDHFATGRPS